MGGAIVGKPICVPYGVSWLFETFHNLEKPERLFNTSRDRSEFSQLLLNIWYEQDDLKDDPALLQKFTYLIDYLASQGEQAAVEVQRRIQS